MKENKYRIWDKESKKMFQWNIVKASCFLILEKEKQFISMQYIGCKDINNKEIYEDDLFLDFMADILRVVWDNDKSLYKFVIWKDNEWWDMDCGEIAMFTIGNMKIIGNVHENPDLLED